MLCQIYILRDFGKSFHASGFEKTIGAPATDPAEFDFAYEIDIAADKPKDAIDHCFRIFNIEHPKDYDNRSLSVGDVVVADGKTFLCRSIGWQELDVVFPAAYETCVIYHPDKGFLSRMNTWVKDEDIPGAAVSVFPNGKQAHTYVRMWHSQERTDKFRFFTVDAGNMFYIPIKTAKEAGKLGIESTTA